MKVKAPFYSDEKWQPRQVNDVLRTSSERLIEPNEGNIRLHRSRSPVSVGTG